MESGDHYTAKEAQNILGMTYSALRNQVNAGNIRSVVPPGRRQAVYSRRDVDQLKREMDVWLMTRKYARPPSAKFVKATVDDMVEAVALANAVFGGLNTIPVEKRIEWLNKNPDIDYLLKQDNQLVGYFSLMPLMPETINDLLCQRRWAKELTADDILPYVPGVPIDLYGMAIGVRPGGSLTQKREWGKMLILGARDVIIGLGKRGIIIRGIKAHSTLPNGIRLMRHIGFTETIASIPGMHNFTIDVEQSGIPFIMEYKRSLRGYYESKHNPFS